MNVALRPGLKRFMADEIRAGRYESPEQMIEAALLHLMFEPPVGLALGKLDDLVAAGEADIKRGHVSDADEVFERLRQKSADFRRNRSKPQRLHEHSHIA
jgi:Arc/MetJ-type ribon-helix-helix transcriptional regulator